MRPALANMPSRSRIFPDTLASIVPGDFVAKLAP